MLDTVLSLNQPEWCYSYLKNVQMEILNNLTEVHNREGKILRQIEANKFTNFERKVSWSSEGFTSQKYSWK